MTGVSSLVVLSMSVSQTWLKPAGLPVETVNLPVPPNCSGAFLSVSQTCRGDLAKSAIWHQQTMNHTVYMRPLWIGSLQSLHSAEDDAFNWLETTVTTALTKW